MNNFYVFVKANIIIRKEDLGMLDKIALAILVIGGLNWGSVGIFQFDLVAFIFGGQSGIVSRIIYILVGLSAIWCVTLLFRDTHDTIMSDRNHEVIRN